MAQKSFSLAIFLALVQAVGIGAQTPAAPEHVTVLHAAHLLDVAQGKLVSPGEVLVRGNHIAEAGSSVNHPAGAEVIDLGDKTLMPGLIDAHVHLFLHPGAEDLQTIVESVAKSALFLLNWQRATTLNWPDTRPSATWAPKAPDRPIPPCVMLSTKG